MRALRFTWLLLAIPLGAIIGGPACDCGEEPPDPVFDAGRLIGEGPPVDPDGGPPYERDAGPVVCEDDAFEDNDTRETATPVQAGALANGVFCGEDDDWFSIEALAGCSVVANLTFDPNEGESGDLDLLLFDPLGQLVASASTLDDHEALNVGAARDGAFALRVRGGSRDHLAYSLELRAICADDLTCPADDPLEDNDDIASSSPIDIGVPIDAVVCPGDTDLFQAAVGLSCVADMTLAFTDANGDLDVELLRADGSLLGASRGTADSEHIVKVPTEAGAAFRVVLFGADADGNNYRIRIDEICLGDIQCPTDDPFEPNDAFTTGEATRLDNERDAVIGTLCGENADYFDVFPTNGCHLRAVLRHDVSVGDIDLELLQSDGSLISSSAGTVGEEQIDFDAPNGNRVVLHPKLFSQNEGSVPRYEMSILTTCD